MIKRPPILAHFIALGLVATVPLMGLLGYNISAQYQTDRASAIDHLRILGQATDLQIRNYLRDIQLILAQVANHPALQTADHARQVEVLKQNQAPRPDLANLAVLDQPGHILAQVFYAPPAPDFSLRQFPEFREGLDAAGFHVSQPYVGRFTKLWTCAASYPVLDPAGRRIGTVVAPLNLPELSRRFFQEIPDPDLITSVLDGGGILLMRSFDADKSIGTTTEQIHTLLTRIANGQQTGEIVGRDGRLRIYTVAGVTGTTWSIVTSLPREIIFASADANLHRSLFLLAGLAGLLAVVVALLARNLNRPISSLALAARAQMQGRDGPLAIEAGPAEIADTARAFNEMITARRQAESLLLENEHRYRTVVDQTSQMIYDVDLASGRIAWFGAHAVERTTGYTLAEFPVTTLDECEEFTHPDDRAGAAARFEQCRATGEPYHIEYRFRQKDGSYRSVEDHGVFLCGPTGRPHRMLGRMSDITERKRAAETLRQIIDLVPHFIYAKDADGRFLLVNETGARVYGITPAELVGKTDADFARNPEDAARFLASDRAVLESGQRLDIPLETIVDHSGQTRYLTTVKIPFNFVAADRPAVLGVSVDITELKLAERERQQIEKKLLETQRLESLGVLAGGIAHDFNNLLTGILGNAGLARHEAPPHWRGLESLADIEKTAHRAADLCKQMLAYSGKGRFVVQRIDLNELLRDTTQLLTISINKKAALRYNLAPTLSAIEADATQLRQIVMNLVINASEAIGERDGLITLSTGHLNVDERYLAQAQLGTELRPGHYVYLEVGDNGAGMPPETLARIFDPFFTTKFTGRGLGLAAVHGIVRGHEGAIKVYSEPDRGTTFKLFFPAAAGSAETLTAPAPLAPSWRSSGRLLVVDDEESVRQVATRIGQMLGFTVDTAVDGLEGLECFTRQPASYALVLLDLTMPRLDGEETFRRLRALQPDVRVVLMSGFNKVDAMNRFVGKGLAGFVQKPFEVATLTAELRRVLEGAGLAE